MVRGSVIRTLERNSEVCLFVQTLVKIDVMYQEVHMDVIESAFVAKDNANDIRDQRYTYSTFWIILTSTENQILVCVS